MNHIQDQNSVSFYFTKLKTIWEELSNFRPVCTCGKCTCGGVKALNSHYQMEYIMSFLMGLHDSFTQVRGQLLLMDPLPPINKVFALISQEEHQRKVGIHTSSISDPASTMAFAVKNANSNRTGTSNSGSHNYGVSKGYRKERPFCTHCNFHGHTIEKCYKIHGYPPGFKPKQRDTPPYSNNHTAVNQVSTPLPSYSAAENDQQGADLHHKKMIGKGEKFEGLYVLDAATLRSVFTAYANNISAHVWHNRLGHLSFKRLDSLKNQLLYDNSEFNKTIPCYICPLAKQRRLSFTSNNHMSQFPFDLVHCDIWGPYHVSSHSGYRFFLTLVDDCTRFTWIFLLKQKSDVGVIIPKFFNMVTTQFNANIKVFRSDNAPELAFTDFFNAKGVLH
ncbi:hypothetical protein UlMin_039354 [Ulmus minor]